MTDQDLQKSTMDEETAARSTQRHTRGWIYDLLLVGILLLGAYFRFLGVNWDEGTYLHPDERFLAMVESSIQPVADLGAFFDTESSSLNPHNAGHPLFVYGTLPIFIVRYVAEWLGEANYGGIARVGRPLSAFFDLGTIFLLYLTASRLYNRRIGLLAAAFSSLAVLQIQLSHFFTVDIFANFFIWLCLYFGARIATAQPPKEPTLGLKMEQTAEAASALESEDRIDHPEPVQTVHPNGGTDPVQRVRKRLLALAGQPYSGPILFYGVFTGMAVASKVSAFPIALFLPLAGWILIARQGPAQRRQIGIEVLILMVISGILAALSFRIFQPYAFRGPGFFDLFPNDRWLGNLTELQRLVQPSNGYPPSVQWFNRPFWFSGQNITLWGLGLPLGLAAWAGVIWMGLRIVRHGEWKNHLLIWGWVVGHFLWQSSVPNPTMRYQLPIYPGMAVLAAWLIVKSWDDLRDRGGSHPGFEAPSTERNLIMRLLAIIMTVAVIGGTFGYAFAFSRIYTREVTRIEASRWFYQNIPGAINLEIEAEGGLINQPIPYPGGRVVQVGQGFQTEFTPKETGLVSSVVLGALQNVGDTITPALLLSVSDSPALDTLSTSALLSGDPTIPGDLAFFLDRPISVQAGEPIFLQIELIGDPTGRSLCDPLTAEIETSEGPTEERIDPPEPCVVDVESDYFLTYSPSFDGVLTALRVGEVGFSRIRPENVSLAVRLRSTEAGAEILSEGMAEMEVGRSALEGPAIALTVPVELQMGSRYLIEIDVLSGSGSYVLGGASVAHETSWDDPLPMRVDGYDGYGGIYQGGLNMELYWEDNAEKRERLLSILDQADIIAISSSRQWGSTTRLPDRYPLTISYYRNLIGCPEDRTIEWCFNVADVGTFAGQLGFDLVKVFQSDPNIGRFEINDQFSEEAFTVYDHPKVLIFKKAGSYAPDVVSTLLYGESVSVTSEAEGEAKSLLLPEERASDQREAGTWSEMFVRNGLINAFYPLTILVWYVVVAGVGLVVYPLIRRAFPGLDDRGYPLARIAGLLILAYLVWLLGSLGLPATRIGITGVFFGMVLVGGGFAVRDWGALRAEWREKRRYFLTVEGIFLGFFLLFLLIRIGNPDLWHPWKGGEKPMDFSYFNAVLKSTTFPPYDPWFAGGYINYYYFGFLYVGVLVEWLGIVPAIAYNLILPTLFSFVGMGAFSISWNIAQTERVRRILQLDKNLKDGEQEDLEGSSPEGVPADPGEPQSSKEELDPPRPYIIGLAGAIGVSILGNLGTVRMIFQGYQRLAAPPEVVLEETFFLTRWVYALQGFFEVFWGNQSLPYGLADWYWVPSRAIPGLGDVEPITEFPFFTFLYADLHAHMIALPLTLLALAWALAVLVGRARWNSLLDAAISFLLAGLVIGALRPTNTWDYPTYLAIGAVSVVVSIWRYYSPDPARWRLPLSLKSIKVIAALTAAVWLVGLSWFLFKPYTDWYSLGYTTARFWEGSRTLVSAYMTHWGLFLFIIVSWMVWETREWLAATPLSAVHTLRPYRDLIVGALVVFVAWVTALVYYGVQISWLGLTLAAWAAVLIFRPGLPDLKRGVLFLIGTGLFLTLVVEVIVLSGDIGRMNTVFKFYLQVWILFAISAAAGLHWLLPAFRRWKPVFRIPWQVFLGALVFSTSLYPVLGGIAKVQDRMTEDSPATLDGMAYMEYARYSDQGRDLELDEDYRAILWFQDNVPGTPTIVEAQVVEYRWGSRFSIYTGLPAVLGWNWHQRQQRTSHDGDVWARSNEVTAFYTTTERGKVEEFLDQYGVKYIVVGQLERAYYDGPGLEKFDAWDGVLWNEVYRDGETVIYEVQTIDRGL